MSFKEKLAKQGRSNVLGSMHDSIIPKQKLVEIASLSIGKPIDMKMDDLTHFSNHTYNIIPEKVEEYKESIEDYGLMTPLIVRDKSETKSGKYEILAGHHRYEACKLLDWKTIPVIIKKGISDAEAKIIAQQTNMMQRAFELLSTQEKAESIYQMKKSREEFVEEHPDIKIREEEREKQGKERQDSLRSVGREFGISKDMVAQYVAICKGFNKSWYDYIDGTNGKKKLVDIYTASILCKMPKKVIEQIFDFINDISSVNKISKEQANKLVLTYNNKEELTYRYLTKVLIDDVERAKKFRPITIKREQLSEFFDENATEEEIMQEIINLLREKRGR